MDLEALRAFTQVADLASFTRAGDRLGLPKGRVSAVVQQLEAGLGTRLLHRTTRVVRLTPDGELFLERCRELLADADELQALFQRSPGALRGRLRVDLSVAVARRFVIPRLPEFLAAHPQLEVELSTTDRRVDVVHDGFDCVLRIGSLEDSGLVARRLGEFVQLNCASPAYLQAHGTPRALEDLARHRVVRYAAALGAAATGFEYHDGERWRSYPMASVITVNNTDAYQAACRAGLGLIQAPALGMEQLLERGELVEVLPQHRGPPLPVSLIYPNRRNLPRRVSVFMDWLEAILQPALQRDARAASAA